MGRPSKYAKFEQLLVYFRPYLKETLEELSVTCDLHLFTAAKQNYADLILKSIDPEAKYFKNRWYKQNCLRFTDKYIKDLNTLNLPLNRTVLVDNSAYSYAYQSLNGIPITSFDRPDQSDTELMALKDFILHLRSQADVRLFLADYFKVLVLHEHHLSPKDCFSKMFAKC